MLTRRRPLALKAKLESKPPVFLHAGWRCGSTYIWSRFRQAPQTTCFYEPFHEVLARCSRRKIRRETSSSWNSRHPPLQRPYRDEYLPLLGFRGVRGYREEFALARYFPSTDEAAPEIRYLSRLLHRATRLDSSAVLGFSRSLARVGVFKQAFGGYHVVICRNPVQQWLSCRSYRVMENASYFELCHFSILALAPVGSPARNFADHLGLPYPRRGTVRQQLDYLLDELRPWSEEYSYRAFLAVYHLSQHSARQHADLVVDLDRLSTCADYRDTASAAILAHTGLTVCFNDCRLGQHDPVHAGFDLHRTETEVVRTLHACGARVQTAPSDAWRPRSSTSTAPAYDSQTYSP